MATLDARGFASYTQSLASSAPITALIIDDEQLAREELKYLLDTTGNVEVLAQGANGIEAVDLIREYQPDVVFLDVQMPGLDGFAVLKQLIEHRDPIPQIIFATAFDQYAVRAFDVNAIDYLLKPFDKNRVMQALDRARLRLQEIAQAEAEPHIRNDGTKGSDLKIDALIRLIEQQQLSPRHHSGKIVLQAQSRLLLVDQKDICFASIDEGIISVVTPTIEGQSKCRTLEELLELLDPNVFWRAHRSFVVNINHIKEVVPWFKSSYQLRMDDKKQTEIPVSRAQTKRLRELFKL
ncbi:two-component system LytT family response regulator/two-component system response regulator LytT [Silvibacterium bohemicum]|uniref:Two-component system LytT family response regulator/two-component system response regulator LytT n=1 Tax=Silvibacterium bohemicum TaxID=1577686 RepID=A0A841JTM3_9BACT|nr:two-component system LytT family response regulator/two-component system response regulator LytT [Silvibacterium bohemicum]